MTVQVNPPERASPVDLGRETDFALGPMRIHPSTCEVETEGRREIVQPRAMQVLVALARARGAVVSRDLLIECCWDGRIIGDDAINRAIAKVRAVAELSDPPAFEIETIPRVGFRLKPLPGTNVESANPSTPASSVSAGGKSPATKGRSRIVVATGALAAAIVTALFLLWQRSPPRQQPPAKESAESSIAVLPFLNMSGDPAKEYFSDGFSEELLNDLANTPQLRVAARTSAFAFKGKRADVREIADKLHVRTVLEGSVRESGDRVRITAQLIDAASGYHIWSQTYDRRLTDVLRVQADIARGITAALTNKLLTSRAVNNRAMDPEAYRKYLLGKFYFDHHNDADNERAIALFKEVTTLQPDFSDGYAMLGYAYLGRVVDLYRTDRDMAVLVTRAALDRALTLNPRNLTALIAYMDLVLFTQKWNAAADFLRLMRHINPNNAIVARASGLYYQFLGFPEQSRAAFRLATQLDPLSHVVWGSLAVMDAVAGHNDEAIAAGETALSLSPTSSGVIAWVCIAHAAKHEFAKARKLAAKLRQLPDGSHLKGCEMEIARLSGDSETARRIVEERVRNKQGDPAFLGQNYLLVGEYEKAMSLLQHAYNVGDTSLYTLSLDPVTPKDFLKTAGWKALTQRPRFREWQASHDKLAAELRNKSER